MSGIRLFSRCDFECDDVSEMPKSRSKGTRKFVGFPESILKSRFEQFDQRVSDVPPEIRSIKDVHLEPLVVKGQGQFTGGAYCRGEFLAELSLRRGWRARETQHVTGTGAIHKPESKLETAWFGGILHRHFGHFLLETLARVQSREVVRSAEPIIFFNPFGLSRLKPFMEGVFHHLGISIDRISFCSTPLDIGILQVQKPTFQLNGFVNVSSRSILKQAARAVPPRSGIIYLSRSKAKLPRRVLEEEQLEKQLEASALAQVTYPERLSFAEQVACLRKSALVTGCEGSAFHTLMFVDGTRTSVMFCPNVPNLSFVLCDELIDGDAIYVHCGLDHDCRLGPSPRITPWALDVQRAVDLIGRISRSTQLQ